MEGEMSSLANTDCRFTCSLIYYALSLNTGTLYGNIYVNTFFSGLVEVPAYILAIFMMDMAMFGRKGTGGLSLISAGMISFICIPLTLLSKYISLIYAPANVPKVSKTVFPKWAFWKCLFCRHLNLRTVHVKLEIFSAIGSLLIQSRYRCSAACTSNQDQRNLPKNLLK